VRLLTDAAATVTDTYDYDAFGNLISRTGTTSNDYLYTGEQFDANLGFYYLRARYLNPSNGRFATIDTFEGIPADPLSLHTYTFCGNNAASCIDPSGNIGIADAIGEINVLTWRATLFVGQYQRVITAGSLLLKTLDIALAFGDTEYRDLSFTLGHNPFESVASLAADAMLAFRYSKVGAEAPYIAERAASAISDLTIVNAGSTLPERELINFTRWSASPTVVQRN
jgi:RHS repeat-associated protein